MCDCQFLPLTTTSKHLKLQLIFTNTELILSIHIILILITTVNADYKQIIYRISFINIFTANKKVIIIILNQFLYIILFNFN